jgi:hypothetical protein
LNTVYHYNILCKKNFVPKLEFEFEDQKSAIFIAICISNFTEFFWVNFTKKKKIINRVIIGTGQDIQNSTEKLGSKLRFRIS